MVLGLILTKTVSLGDLFTGLSVLVSALGIVVSQAHDRRQRRREARAAALESTLNPISSSFEEGLILAEKIAWQQVGQGEYTDREIVEFGFNLLNTIRLVQPRYTVWASEREKTCLKELQEYTRSWNQDYARYLKTRENIPSFDQFLEEIESRVLKIATYIHDTL